MPRSTPRSRSHSRLASLGFVATRLFGTVLGLGFVASVAGPPSFAKTHVAVTSDTIRLTVPIIAVDMTEGGLPADLLQGWETEIRNAWNRRKPLEAWPWRFCGRTIEIVPEFDLRDRSASLEAAAGWNLVAITDRPVSQTQTPKAPRSPLHDQVLAEWSVAPDPWEIAHEFGHVLGLGDEYRDKELEDGTIEREYLTEDAKTSLMGSHTGAVQARSIREVLERHDVGPCDLDVVIDDSMDTGVSPELEHYFWHLKAHYEARLEEDGYGGYTQGSFEADATRRWAAGDGCQIVDGNVEQSVELEQIAGERTGDDLSVNLRIVTQDTREFNLHVTCSGNEFGGPVPAMKMPTVYEISGSLAGGGYLENRTTESYEVLAVDRKIVVTSTRAH